MSYEPLHHKYRPQTFAQLVGQDAIAQTLKNAIAKGRIAPAYLFTGPRGTGKTSSSRILAKSLNCLESETPTDQPCGQCEVCRQITRGNAMDVIEIDAASNTGVDNIREIIEKAQFAPVQCRYKVYVIDECLTGDSAIVTRHGIKRIDDPTLKGETVLSYNETSQSWEYKKVLRWLKRGIKQTLTIKTQNQEIRCTGNHLLRTENGWIPAQDVKEGMRILSPANVDAELSSTNMEQMDVKGDLFEDINLKGTNTDTKTTTRLQFLNKQKPLDPSANVDVKKNWTFRRFCNEKEKEFKAFNLTGDNIPIKKDTEFGKSGLNTLLPTLLYYPQKSWDLSMEHCSEMAVSTTQTPTVDILDYAGLTATNNNNGWNTKFIVYQYYARNYELSPIPAMANDLLTPEPPVTPNFKKWSVLLNRQNQKNVSLGSGLNKSHQKEEHGGIWTMALSVLAPKEVPSFSFIQKDFPDQKINLLLNGLHSWAIPQPLNPTGEKQPIKPTTTSVWERKQLENGLTTTNNIQFPQWTTNSEIVKSVTLGEWEQVYDLEVEDNHNFVANGLLVHNCHMLSVPAFNALLKTLEEPPNRVVFVLATTDPQRVLNTIISRCQRFDFRRIPLDAMVQHLTEIAQKEAIEINNDALTLVAQIANGGLRDAESLLDQLSLHTGEITVNKVWDLVGAVPEHDLLTLLQAIRFNDPEKVISQCRHLLDQGREPLIVLQNLAAFYLNLLIAKTSPHRSDLVAVTAPTWDALGEEAKNWDVSLILHGQKILKESEVQLKNTTQPRLWLEVTLLGLLPQTLTTQAPPPSPPPVQPPTQQQPPTPPKPTQPQQQEQPKQTPPPAQPKPSQPAASQSGEDLLQRRVQASWQQVLEAINPPSTRSLVEQQCTLVDFDVDDGIAYIGVASQPLLKMAEGRVKHIEAAFEKIWHQKIKVKLQVAPGKKKPQSPKPASSPPKNGSRPPQSQRTEPPPVAKQPASPPPPPKPTPPPQTATNGHHNVTANKATPPVEETVTPKPVPEEVETLSTEEQTEDEVQQVAKKFADFFEGEVIDLDI